MFKVTLDLASALPVKVGVESFESEVFVKEEGASGAVVSLELNVDDSLLAGNVAFPAKVSVGIIDMKPRVDNKTADL